MTENISIVVTHYLLYCVAKKNPQPSLLCSTLQLKPGMLVPPPPPTFFEYRAPPLLALWCQLTDYKRPLGAARRSPESANLWVVDSIVPGFHYTEEATVTEMSADLTEKVLELDPS